MRASRGDLARAHDQGAQAHSGRAVRQTANAREPCRQGLRPIVRSGRVELRRGEGLTHPIGVWYAHAVCEEQQKPARELVDAIFAAVGEFRGDTPPNDDMTAVVLRITA